MTRANALATVRSGDIVHGESERGVSLLLPVLDVDEQSTYARRLLTGGNKIFSRNTGMGDRCCIDSIASLPTGLDDIVLNLDRRHHSPTTTEAEVRLTRPEKDALLFIADFYPANPLPKE